MRIMLVDIDSKIPNLALKKIEKYYLDRGNEVIWNMPILRDSMDKIYVSCVFTKNKDMCKEWEGRAEIGGTGYDIKKVLPEEIEQVKPRINWGFTTRGCIRNCEFCFVPEKEGKIRIEGNIYDIWDGKSKELILLDNNILALPEHFRSVCRDLIKENLKVDFNQGLDHRLLTKELAQILLSLKHTREIRFAFDYIQYKPTVLKAIKLLKEAGIKDWGSRWYLYIGPKDTFDTVYERMIILKEAKQHVYVMRDEAVYKKPEYIALATWGNMMGAFKYNLKDLLDKSERLKPYKKYFEDKLGN